MINEEKITSGLNFVFDFRVGNNPLVYNQEHLDANSRKFTITLSRFYVSNIRLIDENLDEVKIDAYLLIKPENQGLYEVEDSIKPGKYVGLKFDIGVDPITNHDEKGPEGYPDGSPLGPQEDVNMYQGTPDHGYYFVRLGGKVDTSVNLNGKPDFNWEFHLLGDTLLRTVAIMRSFEVQKGLDVNINLLCDYEKWLNGIDLGFNHITNPAIARRIANNIPDAFNLDIAN